MSYATLEAQIKTLPEDCLEEVSRYIEFVLFKLNQILVGYYHYYGITDNFNALKAFKLNVERSLFHWLNRRSQKKSYSWKQFSDMLKEFPLARPRIYVSIYEEECA